MAGFRNVVLPLGIYRGTLPGADAGFITPIPVVPIGGEADTAPQGGFGTPLGVLLVRSANGIPQAGYLGIVPVVPLGASEGEIILPEDVHPPGMGRIWYEEDEEIMAIIMSFLEIKR